MGAGASMSPDTFAVVKAEYEARKGDIIDDAEMFNHLRSVLEGGGSAPAAEEHHHTEEAAAPVAEEQHHEAPAEEHPAETHVEAAPVEAAPVEVEAN